MSLESDFLKKDPFETIFSSHLCGQRGFMLSIMQLTSINGTLKLIEFTDRIKRENKKITLR